MKFLTNTGERTGRDGTRNEILQEAAIRNYPK
jgi:hypothetical protein